MNRYMPHVVCVLCLLLGLSVGWYLGYTRPTVENQRKLLQEYEYVKTNFRMSDADMANFAEHQQEYLDATKRQDEFAAAMALGALTKLERELEKAKYRLMQTISIYYRGHRHDGDSNVLRKITTFSCTNAALSNAIYRKLD